MSAWRLTAVALAWGLLAGSSLAGAQPPSARLRTLAERGKQYAQRLHLPGEGLVLNDWGQADLVLSTGRVAGAALLGQAEEQTWTTLRAVLAGQETGSGAAAAGWFPRAVGGTADLESTCRIAPLLAWLHTEDHLPPAERAAVQASLERLRAGLQSREAVAAGPDLVLLRAGALAAVGQALGDEPSVAAGGQAVQDWLREQLARGPTQGLSPSREALGLGALSWVLRAAPSPSEQKRAAQRLAWAALAQRVQPGSFAIAGAAAVTEAADYAQGGELSRYLLHLWAEDPAPESVTPAAMYFLAAAEQGPALSLGDPALPRTVTTAARGEGAITRTDTYLAEQFSLGSMSGPLGPSAVPLLITVADSRERPTAYFFPVGPQVRVASVQQGPLAVMTADFDQVGDPRRPQVYLHGILGPRAEISRVLINRAPWPDQPAAVDEGGVVAVQRGEVYVGIKLLRCGPVEQERVVEGGKPGTLRWQGDSPQAELELLVYARKQEYGLWPLQDNYQAGVLVLVEPRSAYGSLEEFSTVLASLRATQRISSRRERLEPEEDPFERERRRNQPRTRSEYRWVNHLLHELSLPTSQGTLSLRENLVTGEVLERQVGEQEPPTGPWRSPLLSLPWEATQALAALTATE